jgi:hypothetical protein
MSLSELIDHPRMRPRDPDAARLCRFLLVATAAAFDVAVDDLCAPSRRSAQISFARQSAMYLAHVSLGLSYSDVGIQFGRDRTTAAYACQLVEDRRDDPVIDRLLQALENACDAFTGKTSVDSDLRS